MFTIYFSKKQLYHIHTFVKLIFFEVRIFAITYHEINRSVAAPVFPLMRLSFRRNIQNEKEPLKVAFETSRRL